MKTQMTMTEQPKLPMSVIKAAGPTVSTQHLFAGERSCSSGPTSMAVERTMNSSSGMRP